MKILLVHPGGTGIPPLGIMYLAGVLKKEGYNDIKLISLREGTPFREGTYEYLKEELEKKPDVVGVSCTAPSLQEGIEVGKLAREHCKTLMFGGPGPSILREEILKKFPFIDLLVYGEADNTIVPIIKRIENNESFGGINGVIYRENNEIIKNLPNPLIMDLDNIPFPDRDAINIKNFHASFSIFTSRGCPYQCVFCFKPVHGVVWRSRSPKNVVDEIEFLLNKYPEIAKTNGRLITITDDLFNLNIERSKAICDEITKRNLNIKIMCVNGFHARTVDYELFEKMKQAGCKEIWFGLESGNDEILKRIKKGVTVEMMKNAVNLARKAGIESIGVHFIVGLPGETVETVRDTIKLAKELKLNTMGFNHANALPGTEMWEWIQKNGKLLHPIEEMNFSRYQQLKPEPKFETPEFTAKEREMVYDEALAVLDSTFRKRVFSPKNIAKFVFRKDSYKDMGWAVKRMKTLLFKKNLKIQKYDYKPSVLENMEQKN